MKDPHKTVRYTSTVLDGGDMPKFQVIAEDLDTPIVAHSATGTWTTIIKSIIYFIHLLIFKAANKIRNRDHSNAASGPDYFGFSQPTIMRLIQDLPNADKCKDYCWQQVFLFKLFFCKIHLKSVV